MKRQVSIPRVTSKTITVRSLFKKIQRLILDEPKRLNMGNWVTAFQGRHTSTYGQSHPMPACGTVACMAGWGAVLLRPNRAPGSHLNAVAEGAMDELLGHEDKYGLGVHGLFDSEISEYDSAPFTDLPYLPEAGTQEHAEAVSVRIDNYMARHPEILNHKIDVSAARRLLKP